MPILISSGVNLVGGIVIGPQVLDPYYGQVVLLLNFDGTNNSQVITDQSSYADTSGVCVGTSALTTSQTLFGATTFKLNGAGNAGVRFDDSSRFTLGSGEFCIEMWYRMPTLESAFISAQGPASLSVGNSSYRMVINFSGGSYYFAAGRCIAANYFPNEIQSSVPLSANTWYHLAFYRIGSIDYVAVDGIVGNSINNGNPANDSTAKLGVGVIGEGSFLEPTAFMGPFRMTVGAGRYTATNFTPPSGPFPTS